MFKDSKDDVLLLVAAYEVTADKPIEVASAVVAVTFETTFGTEFFAFSNASSNFFSFFSKISI